MDIWPIYGLKSIKLVAYAQIWAYGFSLITQPFFVQSGLKFVYKFKRLLAVSEAPKIWWVLGMLRRFSKSGPNMGVATPHAMVGGWGPRPAQKFGHGS